MFIISPNIVFFFEERVDFDLQCILYKSNQDHLINAIDFHISLEIHLKILHFHNLKNLWNF